MVNVNELKVGNRFIRELHNSRGLEYDHEFILDENAMAALFNQDKNLALQDLFPIPLTPEILLACGFEGKPSDIEKYYLSPMSDNFRMGVWEGDNNKLFWSISNFNCIELKHLHQLQNLFFALTGTELTYNPSQNNNQ